MTQHATFCSIVQWTTVTVKLVLLYSLLIVFPSEHMTEIWFAALFHTRAAAALLSRDVLVCVCVCETRHDVQTKWRKLGTMTSSIIQTVDQSVGACVHMRDASSRTLCRVYWAVGGKGDLCRQGIRHPLTHLILFLSLSLLDPLANPPTAFVFQRFASFFDWSSFSEFSHTQSDSVYPTPRYTREVTWRGALECIIVERWSANSAVIGEARQRLTLRPYQRKGKSWGGNQ